jgi:hypothetical protein
MKIKILLRLLLMLTLTWLIVGQGKAQVATRAEARIIAEKWIRYIIDQNGKWNDSSFASIESVTDFTYGNRLLGYFFKVDPVGYIVVSYRKELGAVKAYSESSSVDPEDPYGMAALLRSCMLRLITSIEEKMGTIETINPEDLDTLLEINYASSWDFLEKYRSVRENQQPSGTTDNYQTPQVLLSTHWHQNEPYNNACPSMGCTQTDNGNAWVGCVATAGAQVMRYWCWPPYGVGSPYNDQIAWTDMPATVTAGSPAAQRAAVAELCHEIGLAVDMDYGCTGSMADTYDMDGVYSDVYHYSSNVDNIYRFAYSASDWFDQIQAQLNVNRPIQYRVEGHSIVCDGWQETTSPFQEWYHMNYGWGGSSDGWYLLDNLYLGGIFEEYIVIRIYPEVSLSSPVSGTYTRNASFPYRYFDRDATGSSATFSSGQYLQMLPGIKVTGTGTTTYVEFQGTSSLDTYIYTNGNPDNGIRIREGSIRMKNNGMLTTR